MKVKLGALMFRWTSGDIESNIIDKLAEEHIEAFIADPEGENTGRRLRSLAKRIGIEPKDFASIKAAAGADLKRLLKEAASGTVPPGTDDSEKKTFIKHKQDWFKTRQGGRELAQKMFSLGVWPQLRDQLLPFCNAIRNAAELDPLDNLT